LRQFFVSLSKRRAFASMGCVNAKPGHAAADENSCRGSADASSPQPIQFGTDDAQAELECASRGSTASAPTTTPPSAEDAQIQATSPFVAHVSAPCHCADDLRWRYVYGEHAQNRRRRSLTADVREPAVETRAGLLWCCRPRDTQIFPMFTPQKIAEHYGFPKGATGKGQKVAVIALDGKLNMEELRKNFQAIGVTDMPDVRTVDVGYIPLFQNMSGSLETHLDVEVIGAICPDATITVYRAASIGLAGFIAAVRRAVDDRNSVISISWGMPESDGVAAWGAKLMDEVLEHARALGITVCAASGDGGSSDERDDMGSAIPADDGAAHTDWPSSHPSVLACGGTQLLKDLTEEVWNNSAIGGGATGGGVSRMYARPPWQHESAKDIVSANAGFPAHRVVPDVAGLAAGGDWLIGLDGGVKTGVGGTSAVAPMWAALVLLANERRAAVGKAPTFVNEHLYQRAHVDHSSLFIDVTMGHNRPAKDYPGYDATEGLDACTGWGVPKAERIISFLADLP